MNRDRDLLARFARHRSEEAFATLVRRHLDLVYGTALRHLRGNESRTTEVTQAVFTALAARGRELAGHPHPADWLYRTTRATAAEAVRTEPLRPDPAPRSQSAHPLPTGPAAEDATGLTAVALHDTLAELDPAGREVILLRFPGGHPPAAVGSLLNLTEEAARAHISRAVEALRERLAQRGITLPSATLHTVLANQAIAAPIDLAASVVAGALTGSAALATPAGRPPDRSAPHLLRRVVPWLAGAVAIGALVLLSQSQRDARTREAEAAQLQLERERLAAALAASERRESDATVKVRELSAKLVEIVSQPPPAPPPVAPKAAPPRADPTAELRAARAARLAQLRPILEAGRPIKGAVVVLVEGRPVQRPVEFVVGRETRIEAVDDGTYVVLPVLNPDGSVKYQITVIRRDLATGTDRSEALPAVTQTPWDPFTVGGPGGRAFAFDPDETVP